MLLHAQPIVDLRTGVAARHELLIRLRDGQEPPLSPADFLPAAERTDLVLELDRWVLQRAVRALANPRAQAASLRLEVNVSARSLENPDLGRWILEQLKEAEVAPERLGLEITETTAIKSLDAARLLATRLTEAGCGFALDDFGAGYGSFSYLKPPVHHRQDRRGVRAAGRRRRRRPRARVGGRGRGPPARHAHGRRAGGPAQAGDPPEDARRRRWPGLPPGQAPAARRPPRPALDDPPADLAEPDPAAVAAGRGGGDDDLVAVLEERRACRRRAGRSAVGRSGVSSINEPRWSGPGPLTVPEAKRSPVRSDAPLTVRWASICAGVQYIAANGGRETTWPLSRTSSARSRPQAALGVVEVGQRAGVARRRGDAGRGPARRAARPTARPRWRTTCRGTGPSGTYSQAWMSRADQSLTRHDAEDVLGRRRSSRRPACRARAPAPTTKPTSASMSSRC